jgi:DNA-binding response OmpR family regulator
MSKGKVRILVVDDEPRYVWTIRMNLEARGYGVLEARDGQAAVDLAFREQPDLIVLDVRMPGMDGFEVCRQVREFSTVPIIMLTALAEDADKVKGLNVGADDYVTKPFSAEELMARVQAVLRRVEFSEAQEPQPAFQAGDLRVDYAKRQVSVGGQEVRLTPTEYRLLCELIRHTGRVLVPDYLLEQVWGTGYEGQNRLLRQAIHRLRQKIEPDPRKPRYIHTRPGSGYEFSSPE